MTTLDNNVKRSVSAKFHVCYINDINVWLPYGVVQWLAHTNCSRRMPGRREFDPSCFLEKEIQLSLQYLNYMPLRTR